MPKVGLMEKRIKGLGLVKVAVKYTTKGQKFYINLPPEMSEVLGADTAKGASEQEARRNFVSLTEKYEQATQTKRKVIVVDWEHRGIDLEGRDGFYSYGNNDEWHRRGLEIGWIVAFEFTNSEEKNYVDLDGEKVYLNREQLLIDWTQEAEDFFKRLTTDFSDLILRVNEFFKDGGPKLLSKIQSHSALPMLHKNNGRK